MRRLAMGSGAVLTIMKTAICMDEFSLVALSNGGCAIVDSCDLSIVAAHSWYSINSRGTKYAKSGKNLRMHRLILGVTDPNEVVDHINGDGLDNRKSNLRIVSNSENVKNRQRARGSNSFPGVYMVGKRWLARVTHDYKEVRLGSFATEERALRAVNEYRRLIGRPEIHTTTRTT